MIGRGDRLLLACCLAKTLALDYAAVEIWQPDEAGESSPTNVVATAWKSADTAPGRGHGAGQHHAGRQGAFVAPWTAFRTVPGRTEAEVEQRCATQPRSARPDARTDVAREPHADKSFMGQELFGRPARTARPVRPRLREAWLKR